MFQRGFRWLQEYRRSLLLDTAFHTAGPNRRGLTKITRRELIYTCIHTNVWSLMCSFMSLSIHTSHPLIVFAEGSRLRLKCDDPRAETRFRLSANRTSPFKSAGASVQSTTGSLVVRISGSNAGYTMFRGSVKSTGYPLHSPVSPSLPLPCVTVCHHISNAV